MKKAYLPLVYSIVITLFFVSCKQESSKKQISLKAFQNMQMKLQRELKQAIQKGGFEHAIQFCSIKSPELESSFRERGFTIRRVSQKPRNPAHIPDSFENKMLDSWMQQINNNKTKTEDIQLSKIENKDTIYIMKPIFIEKELCLKCHGNSKAISSKTKAKIDRLYINDKATGYQLGDLRGAFVARWERNQKLNQRE